MSSHVGRLFKQVSAEHFLRLVPPGATVLDCGTGSGDLALSFANAGYSVEGVDTDEQRMHPLRDNAVPAHVGNVLSLPFANGSYDYVVCRSLLPHLNDWQAAVREMLRVSRKGIVFHHNAAEFPPNTRSKGAARGTCSRDELQALGADRIIPVAALVISARTHEVETALSDPAVYAAALAYEREALPKLPPECASKVIAHVARDRRSP